MARKQKSSLGMSTVVTLILILVVAISAAPSYLRLTVAFLVGIAGVIWLIKKSSAESPQHPPRLKTNILADSIGQTASLSNHEQKSEISLDVISGDLAGSDFHTIRVSTPEQQFTIPKPKNLSPKARWIGKDETINVGGQALTVRMVYFAEKTDRTFNHEPSLIDGRLPVQITHVDLTEKLTGYWPSYSGISPAARRGYLQWLSEGRCAPSVDIGYVFIFFYGLERRVIVDSITDEAARSELPTIADEIGRLKNLYGDNSSFRNYASNLLNHIQIMDVEPQMYLNAPPRFESNGFELPIALRLALGQMALDKHPLNAAWAMAWVHSDTNISRRTAVSRCADQFASLFAAQYSARYPNGLVLTQNKTLLKIAYRSASSRLSAPEIALGDIPDVSATSATRNKLQAIVDECTIVLDPYSRYLGRNPEGASNLEGILQLPVALWPAAAKDVIAELQLQVGDEQLVMTFGELAGRFGSTGALPRGTIVALARALESLNIGFEPDVLSGSRTPKNSDTIVLFATGDDDGSLRTTSDYHAAVVTLDLASAVAAVDGESSSDEMTQLGRHIDSWSHLCVSHRKRLKAHLQIQILQPPTLASLKKKLSPLNADAKRTIAEFLVHLAQADGHVSPQEVRLLERVYKTLELDPQLLYGDLHGAAINPPRDLSSTPALGAESSPDQAGDTPGTNDASRGFNLDMDKIAQLQRETAAVSALLAEVFNDESPEPPIVEVSIRDQPTDHAATVHGLDTEHSAFLRMIVSRREWSRQELEDVATDMELMLDGALEHINDMAFERFDMPVSEGDDPIEINPDILEELAL
ncbi:TerB N-terminal domain-containing protein [Pseudomonas sp. TWRC1-2]|uniref:tellurite resistance TerB family protein n=1 Tax=Pseudomonas sp. TWRC1-2 TaxID=2804628 RepID=UPI003CED2B93